LLSSEQRRQWQLQRNEVEIAAAVAIAIQALKMVIQVLTIAIQAVDQVLHLLSHLIQTLVAGGGGGALQGDGPDRDLRLEIGVKCMHPKKEVWMRHPIFVKWS